MTSRTIATDGAELCVEDSGRDGPALVFLHYWGGSARTWTPVTCRVPERIRTVAISQRGWGGSRVMDGRYDLDALANDVTAVTTALGVETYVLVGHSQEEQVIEDALPGDAEAKRYWPEQGMVADIGTAIGGLELPTDILVGEHDQVERESVLRPRFSRLLPNATSAVLLGVGHLLPLEAPQAVASRCGTTLATAG